MAGGSPSLAAQGLQKCFDFHLRSKHTHIGGPALPRQHVQRSNKISEPIIHPRTLRGYLAQAQRAPMQFRTRAARAKIRGLALAQ